MEEMHKEALAVLEDYDNVNGGLNGAPTGNRCMNYGENDDYQLSLETLLGPHHKGSPVVSSQPTGGSFCIYGRWYVKDYTPEAPTCGRL